MSPVLGLRELRVRPLHRGLEGPRFDHTDLVLDALKQVLYTRLPFGTGELIRHSDCGAGQTLTPEHVQRRAHIAVVGPDWISSIGKAVY